MKELDDIYCICDILGFLPNHFVTCWDILVQNSGMTLLLLTLIARMYSEKNLRKVTRYHPSTGGNINAA